MIMNHTIPMSTRCWWYKPSTMKASFLSASYVLLNDTVAQNVWENMCSYRIYWCFIVQKPRREHRHPFRDNSSLSHGEDPVRRRREVAMILPAPKIRLWLVPDDFRDPAAMRKSESLSFGITKKIWAWWLSGGYTWPWDCLDYIFEWYAPKLQWPATNQ
jgi:hypothetical protein